jgi:hypothetical protein
MKEEFSLKYFLSRRKNATQFLHPAWVHLGKNGLREKAWRERTSC